LLLVGVWMSVDHHRTAAIILTLTSLASQLVGITLERRWEEIERGKWRAESEEWRRKIDTASSPCTSEIEH
jgi:hypothetical protein